MDTLWFQAQSFIFIRIISSEAVIAHHPHHVLFIFFKAGECTQGLRHFRRCFISNTGHDRGDRTGNTSGFFAVIRNTAYHQHGAEVGITQSQGTVLIAQLGHFFRRELCHQYGYFEYYRPETGIVLISFHIEYILLCIIKLHQVG